MQKKKIQKKSPTKKRLLTLFQMNKDMIDRRANTDNPETVERDREIAHSIFGKMCQSIYDRDNLAKLAGVFSDVGALACEDGAIHLRGIDSYDLLDERARKHGLSGLLIGYEDDSWPLHVQRQRPYLFAPIRSLAALETLLDLWGDGKEFWSEGIGYSVSYLKHLARGVKSDHKLAQLDTWTSMQSENLDNAVIGMFYLNVADDFVSAVGNGFDFSLTDGFWFLEDRQIDEVKGKVKGIVSRIFGEEGKGQ